MKKHRRYSAKAFRISERPVPVHAWTAEDDSNHFGVIEDDVRKLIRELSEARFALAEQEKRVTEDTRRFLLSILDTLDAFQRVFDSIETKKEEMTRQTRIWVGNFRAVYRLLRAMLAERSVTEIENLDHGFDPHWHKIVETVADPSRPDGTIMEEVHKGYVWQNQILRKAEVIVVRNSVTGADVLPKVVGATTGAPSADVTDMNSDGAKEADKSGD